MNDQPIYNAKMRALQARFGTEALADALARHNRREAMTAEDVARLEGAPHVFLATADGEGFADCSYKGLLPGHLKVLSPTALSFPWLDGNGMFRSLGNILDNPSVGLLFIDFKDPKRLRVNGTAYVVFDDPRQAEIPGAQLMVHVTGVKVFSNCPRYIQQTSGESEYFEVGAGSPRVPDWKMREAFNAVLPDSDPAKGKA